MDIYEIGVILTIFLVSITGIVVYADQTVPGVNILSDSEGFGSEYLLTKEDMNEFSIPQEHSASGESYSSATAWMKPAADGSALVGKTLFTMAFGYSFIIDKIFNPIGAGLLGLVFKGIFFIIQGFTLLMFLWKSFSVLRGGGPGG